MLPKILIGASLESALAASTIEPPFSRQISAYTSSFREKRSAAAAQRALKDAYLYVARNVLNHKLLAPGKMLPRAQRI